MNLSAKHQQNTITYSDFTGGLNTTTVPEMIGDNQMADCVNMEFNHMTGALQTSCGTVTVFQVPEDITINKIFYDEINNAFLFTDKNTKAVYQSRLVDMTGTHTYDREKVGTLSGDKTPTAVMWENGLLIASGGRLQYWNGTTLSVIRMNFGDEQSAYEWENLGTAEPNWSTYTNNNGFELEKNYTKNKDVVKVDGTYYLCKETHTSISDAPSICNGVFVKNGRVYIWHEYRLQCSGVGDERCWYDVSGDDSTSKWIDIGYKEGEHEKAYIIGACSLSSDIVVIKNDGKIYRLAGEYPDWSLKEVARNITCLNPLCYTAVQDGVFIVGREGMFFLETTVDYGDVRPTNVASNILNLMGTLSLELSYVQFMPSLNQIWVAGFDNKFICFDLAYKAFFQRQFNSPVNGICAYKSYFMLARNNKVVELMPDVFKDEMYSDDEAEMEWRVVAKSHTSLYDFLLKRMRLVYVPLQADFDEAQLITAEDKIKIDIPESNEKVVEISTDNTLLDGDNRYLFPMNTQFVTKWMVYRNRIFGIKLVGKGSAILLNRLDSTIAEV